MMFLRCPCCDKSLSEYERFNFEDNDGWCNECISISAQDVREWEETYVKVFQKIKFHLWLLKKNHLKLRH